MTCFGVFRYSQTHWEGNNIYCRISCSSGHWKQFFISSLLAQYLGPFPWYTVNLGWLDASLMLLLKNWNISSIFSTRRTDPEWVSCALYSLYDLWHTGKLITFPSLYWPHCLVLMSQDITFLSHLGFLSLSGKKVFIILWPSKVLLLLIWASNWDYLILTEIYYAKFMCCSATETVRWRPPFHSQK